VAAGAVLFVLLPTQILVAQDTTDTGWNLRKARILNRATTQLSLSTTSALSATLQAEDEREARVQAWLDSTGESRSSTSVQGDQLWVYDVSPDGIPPTAGAAHGAR
jgi:hypothetical protein